jgi:hypothetical protein
VAAVAELGSLGGFHAVPQTQSNNEVMKNILFLIVSVLAFGLVASCSKKATASFEQRMAAGQAVMDQKEQNRLMADLAKDAADAGNASIVNQALGRISDDALGNDIKEACALKLAKAGKQTEALQVAKMITSQAQQNSVLSKLAK